MSALGYFFSQRFLDYWGCLVHCETDFVKFWVDFDQNNAKEGRPKFYKLKVGGYDNLVLGRGDRPFTGEPTDFGLVR